MRNCDEQHGVWIDSQVGANGNWVETLRNAPGWCLDSNARGSVYVGRCEGNGYQQWSEEKWKRGWVLRNVATGRCLARDSNIFRVQTLPCDEGNSGQYWE
ncbi:RICIN domain-containing protein [Streptomyces roseoverticillatus]|uniref:RICIN domain-containing protein n=1 Tax=Streptomyces roseoverticillatus TaxID=66429 RepID=UPI0035AC0E00